MIPPNVRLARAISRTEGFGIQGAIPTLANNPGDLCLGDKFGLGVLGEGITICPTPEQGWLLLYRETELMLSGGSHVYSPSLTLTEVGKKYANGDPNWARNVAADLGLPVTTTLAQIAQMNF